MSFAARDTSWRDGFDRAYAEGGLFQLTTPTLQNTRGEAPTDRLSVPPRGEALLGVITPEGTL